jgi:hypothetical protein
MKRSFSRQVRYLSVLAVIILFAAGSAVVLAKAQGGAAPASSLPSCWDSAATWIAALANIILAVVAILQEPIRGLFYRPKFQLSVKTEPPDCVLVPLIKPDGCCAATAVYLRLWVENIGNATGRNVEVYAQQLRLKRSDERWERVSTFPPMNLKWANVGTVYFPSIAPAMGKHCDVAHITDPSCRDQFGEDSPQLDQNSKSTSLVFELMAAPSHRGHIVGPGSYELDLLVAADNVRPRRATLSISLQGTWYGDEERMLRDGVGITVRKDA